MKIRQNSNIFGSQYAADTINIGSAHYSGAEDETNSADITMKLKPSEKRLVMQIAVECGMKNSEFVRHCVKNHLKAVSLARQIGRPVTQVVSDALCLYLKWQKKRTEAENSMLAEMAEGRVK